MSLIHQKLTRTHCCWAAWLVLYFLVGGRSFAQTSPVLELKNPAGKYSIKPFVYSYFDQTGTADFETVNVLADEFVHLEGKFANKGFSSGVLWLRFSLKNASDKQQRWFLEVGNPHLDEVIFYEGDPAAGLEPIVTGDLYPVRSRPYWSRTYQFPIVLEPWQTQTFFVRVKTQGSLQAPLELRSVRDSHSFQLREIILFSLYFGLVLALLLYNAFLAIPLRTMGYPFYVLYIAGHFLAQMAYTGLAPLLLWPESPWWANRSMPVLVALATFSGMQFTFQFLGTKTLVPRLHRWVVFANPLVTFLGVCLGLMAPYRLAAIVVLSTLLVWCAIALVIGLFCLIRKRRQAVFYLLGWGGFLIGVLGNIFRVLGWDISLEATTFGMLAGSAAELLILSLGLADRINIIGKEKAEVVKRLASQNSALRYENSERQKAEAALLESRQELENQVLERTKDLASVNTSLLKEIDNHKKTEAQLLLAHQRAEEESLAKSSFLANMSHEIRTPLNAIVGLSELLLDESQEVKDPQKRKHYVENIYRSGHHLSQVINHILDLSKIEAGKLDLSMEVVRLPALVRDVFEVCFQQAQAKEVQLSYQLAEDLPEWIETDHTALRRILLNLVGNAVKFTPKLKRVDLSVAVAEGKLVFKVEDQGIGIPQARQEAIFNAFEQADNTTTRQFGGTGLGLAISQKLAQLLGGDIKLSSQEGVGSCFTVLLPYKICNPPAPGNEAKKELNVRFDPESVVLVAEDNKTNLFVLRALLAKVGLSVHHAENGQEAVIKAKQLQPDLILMDMHMPIMDGIQATKQIRQQDGTEAIPVVAITADAFKEKKNYALNHGLNDYLVKPISMPQLVEVLSRFLKKAPDTMAQPKEENETELPTA